METTRKANLPFSDAAWAGDTLYLNNQIGNAPGQGAVVKGGLDAELAQALRNIDGVLAANGLARANLVMCTVSLADVAHWPALNRLWRAAFSVETLPARNVVSVVGLPLKAAVSVQCVASRG